METLDSIIQPEVWTRALEKYTAATRLTVAVHGPSRDLLLGPIQSSPLFEVTEVQLPDQVERGPLP